MVMSNHGSGEGYIYFYLFILFIYMSKAPPPVSQRELHRVCLINFVCILLETQLEWVWDYVTHLTPPVLHPLETVMTYQGSIFITYLVNPSIFSSHYLRTY